MGVAKISPSSAKASAIAAAQTSARVASITPLSPPRAVADGVTPLVGDLVAGQEPLLERRPLLGVAWRPWRSGAWNASSRS